MLCVGIDPDPSRFPSPLKGRSDALFAFCTSIADATAPFACAFKPQIAYFASLGAEDCLEALMDYLRQRHPGIPLILDAKRGDIGDTAEMYAREAFDRYGADAVTVNPYLGTDSLEPFFARRDRGTFVLCRTSNAGSGELQAQTYETVARRAADDWSKRAGVGLVVGATQPAELRRVREIVGDLPLLVPGVGAQGGDAATVVREGATSDGTGLVVNSSRAILYASSGDDYADAARRATTALRDALNAVR